MSGRLAVILHRMNCTNHGIGDVSAISFQAMGRRLLPLEKSQILLCHNSQGPCTTSITNIRLSRMSSRRATTLRMFHVPSAAKGTKPLRHVRQSYDDSFSAAFFALDPRTFFSGTSFLGWLDWRMALARATAS